MKPKCFLPVGRLRGLQGLVTAAGSPPLVQLPGGLGVDVNKEQVEVGRRKGTSEPNG